MQNIQVVWKNETLDVDGTYIEPQDTDGQRQFPESFEIWHIKKDFVDITDIIEMITGAKDEIEALCLEERRK